MTLAVHLHNRSPSLAGRSREQHDHNCRMGWHDAASRIMATLQELTDELSPAAPCTTLPPVLTRSKSTGKGDDGNFGLPFELSVVEALQQIQLKDDPTNLRKVVLVRKVNLNLDFSVGGLDVLMRMQLGGHIGHFFLLNPGNYGG